MFVAMRDDDERGIMWRLPKLQTKDWGKLGPAFGYGVGCGVGLGAGIVGGPLFFPSLFLRFGVWGAMVHVTLLWGDHWLEDWFVKASSDSCSSARKFVLCCCCYGSLIIYIFYDKHGLVTASIFWRSSCGMCEFKLDMHLFVA